MDIEETTVRFVGASMDLHGFLAKPVRATSATPHPGLVVVHESFGLNQNIKDITRRLANEGYVALAIDLFTGRNRILCLAKFFAAMAVGSVDHAGIADMRGALDTLARRDDTNSGRLGAIGFCMGGNFALALACTDGRLRAIAPFYATNPRPIAVVGRACPVVGSYAALDPTALSGRALEAELTRQNVVHDIKIYPKTMHSFMNNDVPTHAPEAAQDAWTRTLKFFEAHI